MKKKILWVLLGVAVAISLGGWAIARRGGEGTEVQVGKVGREDVQAKVTANGKVQAQKKVDISATIPGQITHLAVKEGDEVKRGQFLLQIDPVNPRSAVRSTESSMQALLQDLGMAQSNLAQARADYQRAKGNHDAKIISDADFSRVATTLATNEAAVNGAQRRVDQARATLEGVRDTLSKTTIHSPIDGVVTAKRVEEGEVAVIGVQNSPGTVLLTISDMSVVETEMEVDETSIPGVKLGQKARVRIDAYPNQTFDGVVTEVGSSPISGTGTATEAIKFKVKVRIENPPADVKPGLSAQADILTGFRADALIVPIQALVLRDAEEKKPGQAVRTSAPREVEGVYLMENGKARFQPVKTGLQGELAVEVLSGLKGGETLITGSFKALRTLKPGDAVKLEKPKKGEERPAA
ncbi:MAG: HlyD family secretion protein [Acidobacteriota bacterium]|jgi:HlyD family secretion protein|nr:HlyD family secretion protein [Acidobacteriota bacterium]